MDIGIGTFRGETYSEGNVMVNWQELDNLEGRP